MCLINKVSMPSWAWVVTITEAWWRIRVSFQCPHGLELLLTTKVILLMSRGVSMPSWAWVVTARMSNILNFSWYFLCIPAIYKCILAYLPIFFNQLSKFLRCESPSTFLGTCLSHHSFIIFLVTNTNTLLSGLYLISTYILLEVSSIGETVFFCRGQALDALLIILSFLSVLFCRGQALDAALLLLLQLHGESNFMFQCPHGLELLQEWKQRHGK